MLYIKLLVLNICTVCVFCARSKYCNYCANHTLCVYSNPGPSKICIGYDTSSLLDHQQIKEILHRVNEKRNFVALGLSRKLPKAANMKKMLWSEELATFAQRWADQCDGGVDQLDECRDLEQFPVGQNIASVVGPSPGISVKAFVDIWFMQVADYNGSISYYNRSQDGNTDFFTQLIWAETYMMGCGKAKFYLTNKRSETERLVCNFAPKGNIDGRPVYAIGVPSTQCSTNMTSDGVFNGLCTGGETKEQSTPASSTLVSSLLRIINLSNQATENETDPNRNNNSKENLNQRLQKIRHIYNDSEPADLSKYHEAEEKFKDYLMKYAEDHTFYDYIHGFKSQPQVINTPQYRSSKPPTQRYLQQFGHMNPYQTQYKYKSCTRSPFPVTCNNFKKIITDCTRKSKAAIITLPITFRDTHCTCNADCRNPAKTIVTNYFKENRRQKTLIPKFSTNIQVLSQRDEGFNYYDILYNPKLQNDYKLRAMRPPQAIARQPYNFGYTPVINNPNHWIQQSRKPYWFLDKKRRKRSGDKITFKPFWQDENYQPRSMPMLKSLKYTTLAQAQRNKKQWRKTTASIKYRSEKITVKLNIPQNSSTEKYLSFEELMHLRKHSGSPDDSFLHARRTNAENVTVTTPITITTETVFERVKHCTKKLTCTWTAVFQYGSGGAGGNGSGYGGNFIGIPFGTRTPPGYVEGCTRTWTCTRPYYDRNVGPTSASTSQLQNTAADEDYCEKRALERRNLDIEDYTQSESDINSALLYTTVPMPSDYESPKEQQDESFDTCPCNEESSRRRRHTDTIKGKHQTVINTDLSYGELFYLVVQKFINNAHLEDVNDSNCGCSNTANKQFRVFLPSYLIIFIKIIC